jgi:RNA polymerase sigma-70 factor (ECF subfamily)
MKTAEELQRYRSLDREILDQVRVGRYHDGCRLLIESYGPEILGTCINRCGDRSLGEDAAQDVLARAIRSLLDYRGDAGLRPWLHRIAANRCIDMLRSRQSRLKRHQDEASLDCIPGPEIPLPSEQAEEKKELELRLQRVRAALEGIKEPDRTWLELHYTHGVAYDELADDAGLTRAAVKQRIWRAVKKVRSLLANDEE